jgi:tRNA 2-thiouridine synthesizing protein A|tara:strand:- start:1278 stop:1523 length:246 start_codon:yes stop_codon:yes gene_type:complete
MKYKVENNEIILDTSGTECPIPVLKARKLSQTLKDGDIVKVICTDPLAEADFKHYCEQSKYDFIDCEINNKILIIRFKFKK